MHYNFLYMSTNTLPSVWWKSHLNSVLKSLEKYSQTTVTFLCIYLCTEINITWNQCLQKTVVDKDIDLPLTKEKSHIKGDDIRTDCHSRAVAACRWCWGGSRWCAARWGRGSETYRQLPWNEQSNRNICLYYKHINNTVLNFYDSLFELIKEMQRSTKMSLSYFFLSCS